MARGKVIRAPLARMGEQVAKLTEDERQRAAVKHGVKIGDDDTLQVFHNRAFLAQMIRREEKHSPVSKWKPVVPLKDNEGY